MNRLDLTGVIRQIDESIEGDRVSLGQIVRSLQDRGFGPLLLGPALIALLPTGAVPGVPTVCGVLIVLVAVQLIAGKPYPWLPHWLRDRYVTRTAFDRGRNLIAPATRRIDAVVYPRLNVFTRGVAPRFVAALCALLAVTMIPLELVPFAAAAPALAIAMMALGLSARDGLLVLVGLVAAIMSVGLLGWFFL